MAKLLALFSICLAHQVFWKKEDEKEKKGVVRSVGAFMFFMYSQKEASSNSFQSAPSESNCGRLSTLVHLLLHRDPRLFGQTFAGNLG